MTPRKGMSFTTKSLIGLVAGFGGGVIVHALSIAPLASLADTLEPFGTLWVNALRMLVIPLVLSNLVLGIADTPDGRRIGRMGGLSFGLFVAFLIAGTAFALILVPPILSRFAFDPASLGTLSMFPGAEQAARTAQEAAGASEGNALANWLFTLVPKNPFKAAADGAILPLLVFSVPFAFAVTFIREESRRVFLGFVRAVCEATFVFLRWVLWFTPAAVFVLTFAVATRAGMASVGAVGFFVVLVSLLLVAFLLLVYPITGIAGGIGLRRFAHGVTPAQTVAVATRSSLASLPSLLEGADQRLRLPGNVTGLVLPLAVSTFKVNTAVSSTTKFLFLSVLYGLDLGWERVLTFVIASLLLSFSSPGIPTAPGSVTRLPAYLAAGIPLEGVMILSAVDAIPDIFKTVLNVTADMSVAVIVTRFVGGGVPAEPAPAQAAAAVSAGGPQPPTPA